MGQAVKYPEILRRLAIIDDGLAQDPAGLGRALGLSRRPLPGRPGHGPPADVAGPGGGLPVRDRPGGTWVRRGGPILAAGARRSPVTRIGALYFTVTVFSTLGFGDIAAKSELAPFAQLPGRLLLRRRNHPSGVSSPWRAGGRIDRQGTSKEDGRYHG
jgi:hypothetical protein